MKNLKSISSLTLILAGGLILSAGCFQAKNNGSNTKLTETMKNVEGMATYVIEREIKDVGQSTAKELKTGSKASCNVLEDMGSDIQWQHSYIAEDKIYCVYKARSTSLIREHARKVGVPANYITRVSAVTDPSTAE